MKDATPLILKTLSGQPTDRIGVWLMRQAGRYLPEYRALREKAGSFNTLCQTPELACEVTLQPIQRFALDAAIQFSDILTVVEACGHPVTFVEHTGPIISQPIRSVRDIEQLPCPDVHESLGYVFEAIKLTRRALPKHLPLIGFAGSPWTLATYFVEGGSSKTFTRIKSMRYQEPQATHQLLHKLSTTLTAYLRAQIEAGADLLMLFDTWGGLLSHDDYIHFSLNYLKHIIQSLKLTHPNIPILLFTKGGGLWLQDIAASGVDGISLDWSCSLKHARTQVGHHITLQGNLDPTALLADSKTVVTHVKKILQQPHLDQRFIFNLGHGILPQTPTENVAALIETVHNHTTATTT